LNDEILNKQPKGKYPPRTLQPPVEKLPPPKLKADGSLRFPWAARLSPQSRNIYRAATPTYRLDGTPEVSIPSKVLKLDIIPQQKDNNHAKQIVEISPALEHNLEVDVHHLSAPTVDRDDTENPLYATLSSSSLVHQENHTATPNSFNILSTLVDSQSIPTTASIMESSPSNIINSEVCETFVVGPLTTKLNPCAFESPSHFTARLVKNGIGGAWVDIFETKKRSCTIHVDVNDGSNATQSNPALYFPPRRGQGRPPDRHRRLDVATPPRFASKVSTSDLTTRRLQNPENPFLPSVHTAPPEILPPRGGEEVYAESRAISKTGSDTNLRSKSRLSPPSTFLGSRRLSMERRYLPPSVAKDSLEEDLRQSQGEHVDLG
ncbi:hypothetical protein HID58_094204, partial [Brassica napus]